METFQVKITNPSNQINHRCWAPRWRTWTSTKRLMKAAVEACGKIIISINRLWTIHSSKPIQLRSKVIEDSRWSKGASFSSLGLLTTANTPGKWMCCLLTLMTQIQINMPRLKFRSTPWLWSIAPMSLLVSPKLCQTLETSWGMMICFLTHTVLRTVGLSIERWTCGCLYTM